MTPKVIEKKWQRHDDLAITVKDAAPWFSGASRPNSGLAMGPRPCGNIWRRQEQCYHHGRVSWSHVLFHALCLTIVQRTFPQGNNSNHGYLYNLIVESVGIVNFIKKKVIQIGRLELSTEIILVKKVIQESYPKTFLYKFNLTYLTLLYNSFLTWLYK